MIQYLKAIDYKKLLITLISVLFMGISLSVLNVIGYGTDPFSFMNISISQTIGLSLGNWQMILNILMFIPVILWGRKQIGIGTVLNMVLIGYTVDVCMWLWGLVGLPELMATGWICYGLMPIALVIFIFSAATYMSAGMGTSPFDALPLMIHGKLSKVPFKVVRFFWDLSAVAIGLVFGGNVGIVTLLMVPFLGQAVEFVSKKFFSPKA